MLLVKRKIDYGSVIKADCIQIFEKCINDSNQRLESQVN